jgi:hypothetical protein
MGGYCHMNLRVNFDREEQKKLEDLKKIFGLKQNTELIRFLITQSHKEHCDIKGT